jgi:hypothetical protein
MKYVLSFDVFLAVEIQIFIVWIMTQYSSDKWLTSFILRP